jgi:hypothetical protein
MDIWATIAIDFGKLVFAGIVLSTVLHDSLPSWLLLIGGLVTTGIFVGVGVWLKFKAKRSA